MSLYIHNLHCTTMRKKLFLVLVSVGLIIFLSLEAADSRKVVSKEGKKEKIGNQLPHHTRRVLENATVYVLNSTEGENDKVDDKKCGEDQEHDEDGEDEDNEDGESEEDGDDGNDEDGDSEEDGDEGNDEDGDSEEDGDEGNDEDGENEEEGDDEQHGGLHKRGDVISPAEKRPRRKPPASREVHDPPN